MNRYSFVVSCYNYERYLAECLDSLTGQDFPADRFEIVCVDDGSTDGTPELLARYAARHTNVRVIRTENGGLEKACNTGVRAARYDWIVRTDADDAMDRLFLKTLDRAIGEKPGFDLYYCGDYVEHYSDTEKRPKRVPAFDAEEIFERGDFFATGTAYRKSDLLAAGLFPEKIKNCGLENYTVILKLLSMGKRGAAVPGASFLYRRHPANMSTLRRAQLIAYGKDLLAGYGRPFLANENHPYGLRLVTAIIQARAGSTRLPGKVFSMLAGKPFIEHVVERVRRSAMVSDVVVATTDHASDDALAARMSDLGVRCFRGSQDDVLDRFYRAAKRFHARHILRVTADDPFKDPDVTDAVIDRYMQCDADYVSNNRPPSYPEGLDVEVFSLGALERAAQEAADPFEREHVTPYFYRAGGRFKTLNVSAPADLSHLRWTVDTANDLEMARRVYAELYPAKPDFRMKDVLELFARRPELAALNANEKRSALYTP